MKFRPSIVHAHSLVLLVLAGLLINQWWDLRELASRTTETSPLSASIETLDQQQTLLREDVDALSDGRFVSAELYQAEKNIIGRELVALKRPAADTALLQSLQQDLLAIKADVEVLQKALQEVRRLAEQTPPSVVKKTPRPPKPSKPSVPFTMLGIEHRGGESFLAVSPLQNAQLQDVQLLRPGESRAGWQLRSLTSTKAQFGLPNGRTQSFNLDQGAMQ
jgi:hypothetical protein